MRHHGAIIIPSRKKILSVKQNRWKLFMAETTTSLDLENVIMVENATSWSKMQDEGRKNLTLSK